MSTMAWRFLHRTINRAGGLRNLDLTWAIRDNISNPEDPDARQWQPELIVVDVDNAGVVEEELWAFWTQNLGITKGTYFARLKAENGPGQPEWTVEKLDLSATPLNPSQGFAFVGANAIQLKAQDSSGSSSRDGCVLVPVTPENETNANIENDIAVLYTCNGGMSWSSFPRITPDPTFDVWEPMLAEHPDSGQIFLYVRNRNRENSP
ncbi:MAG: hypothetical protein RLN72_16445 [Henriciella sp.]